MTVSTPCIQVCNIDRKSGLCTGCRRNRDEIGNWMRFPEEQRQAIMRQLPARRFDVGGDAAIRQDGKTG